MEQEVMMKKEKRSVTCKCGYTWNYGGRLKRPICTSCGNRVWSVEKPSGEDKHPTESE